jgi:hypothetical protein
VDVFNDQHIEHIGLADLTQQRAEQRMPTAGGLTQLQKGAAELIRNIEQRLERTRRERPITGAPGPPSRAHFLPKALPQRRLPDTGLPRDQHQTSLAPTSIIGVLGQQRQQRPTLPQTHPRRPRHTAP